MESGSLRVRLSIMMFAQYLGIGAWAVPLATFISTKPIEGGLNFSPAQTALIYSATAFIGLVAPLVLGLLADRLFAAQRILGVLHLSGATILFFAGRYCESRLPILQQLPENHLLEAETQETFRVLFLYMLGNAVVLVLTVAISNVVCFRNLQHPKKSFGSIRLFGTVAWIIINITLDIFGNAFSAEPLYLAAYCSLFAGVYSFTLPHTPPRGHGKTIGEAIGLPALGMFRNSDFRILIASALCMAAIQQFYSVFTNPFLKSLNAPKPTALQTVAQFSEVICMMLCPYVMLRFGMKWTLAIGICGWVVRNLIFAVGSLPLISIVGLPLHGMCYTFFFIVANIYVDRHAPGDLRASAQGIFTFTSMGCGTLIGNFVSARVLESMNANGSTDWTFFWLVPAAAALVVFVFFVYFFRETAQTIPDDPPENKLEPETVS